MDFSPSEQQEMVRKTAKEFFAKELPKTLVKEMAKEKKGYTVELWQKMAELGWMGLVLPEEYGGSAASFLDLAILLEEMGRACLPGPFFSTVVLGALTLVDIGSEDQKKRPRLAKGEIVVTLALAEPHAIYRPDFFEVEASKTPEGYVISGTKLFVPDAHVAAYIIVAAKTQGGVTLFLVDTKKPGLSITALPAMAGERQCEVKFNGVKVSVGDVLGEVNRGREYIERIVSRAAAAKCAEMLGGAEQVLEMSVAYAKDRVAFGRPIGSYQAIQHHCANMLNDLDGCRCMTYRAAWMVSEGLPCAMEVSLAKAWVNQAYRRITCLGHEIHGAIAFQDDHDMHLYFKQAKVGEVAFGDTAYHSEIVAKSLGL
ncbi:MAG: acyl-CoA/acyl-ACP dehydrogenase [Chloroflexi bacterium]|nr:acyl-CoA/acyl-ACP dehydrogenase [Chloroflexota bacterium]